MAPLPLAQEIKNSGAIFAGQVVSVTSGGNYNYVTLQVTRVWKGKIYKTTKIATAPDEGSCGYPFSTDTQYLVYGSEDAKGNVLISQCSSTKPLAGAGRDLGILGQSSAPLPNPHQLMNFSLFLFFGVLIISFIYFAGRQTKHSSRA